MQPIISVENHMSKSNVGSASSLVYFALSDKTVAQLTTKRAATISGPDMFIFTSEACMMVKTSD